VLVENLEHDIELDGLTVEQLRTDVELKLRLVGISVANADSSVGSYLYINVSTMKNGNFYAYFASIEFRQPIIRSHDALVDLMGNAGWSPEDKAKWLAGGGAPPISVR